MQTLVLYNIVKPGRPKRGFPVPFKRKYVAMQHAVQKIQLDETEDFPPFAGKQQRCKKCSFVTIASSFTCA